MRWIGSILIIAGVCGCQGGNDARALDGRLERVAADRMAAHRAGHSRAGIRLAARSAQEEVAVDGAEYDAATDTDGASASAIGRGPLPGLWDTIKRDAKATPETFWTDTTRVYGDTTNLVVLGLSYGGALAVQQTGVDDTVEDSFKTHRTFKGGFRDAMSVAGSPLTHFGLAGLWYVVGQQTGDEKTYEVGRKLFRALTLTGVSTLFGKVATWEDAPNGEWGAFPSGHTSSTFAFASVMHREYGPWVGAPLYALGGLIGYARLEDREHYFSDVIMGGVLGLVIGHTVAGDGEPLQLWGGEVVPYVDALNGSSGVAWQRSF